MRATRTFSRGLSRAGSAVVLAGMLLFAAACGAGAGNEAARGERPSPSPPAVGWNGEVDDAPYVAFERVSFQRLPKDRVEPAGEVRLPEQVRRVSAFRLRDEEASAIRFTSDGPQGWLAWEPAVVLVARRELARASGARQSDIATLGVARVQWPDGCLGIAGAACNPESTPGFRVSLRLRGTHYLYHTDLRDRVVPARG